MRMSQFEMPLSETTDAAQAGVPVSTRIHSQTPKAPQLSEPLSVRVREACRLTGIGRSKLYELISAGEIEIIKVGTITLIPVQSLRHFLDACRKA